MTQAPAAPAFRYRAFISYSHQDRSWAGWLHKALEAYVVPKRLVGQTTAAGVTPRRLSPVFRDRDELASATDLGNKVNQALAQSECLVVICSPRAATSRWVDQEVLAFKRLGRSERIFCLIVDGEPGACELPGREAEECFTPALRHSLGTDGALGAARTEPIAADVRPGKDGKTNAKLKLIAGMLDIGFDALKRREMQRRTRRVAAVAVIALSVMTVTTALAIAAVIARNAAVAASLAAERRQKQAEDLVDFMLGDLNEKLAQTSRLDIMESVDDQAMNYFQSMPTVDVTDETLAQRVKTLERIGSIRLDQGHVLAAMASYQAALKLAAPLAAGAPANVARQLACAEVWAFIGMTHWRQGELDAAQQSFAAAQALLQRAHRLVPNEPALQFQLATIDNNIGHVLEARGQLDEALTQYASMLPLMQQLIATQPGNTEWMSSLGSAYNNLGRLALMRGELAAAVAHYKADDAIETALATRDPKDVSQRDNMLTVRAILGRTQALTGDLKTGMSNLQQAVDIATQLSTVDPSNTDFREHAALYAIQLARLRRLSGDLPAATALTARALNTFAALTTQDPANTAWQREFAEAQLEQAAQSRAAGRIDASRMQSSEALRALDPMLARQPEDRATLLATAGARLSLAAVEDASAARPRREDALRAMEAAKSGRDDPRLLALQVETLLALGKTAEAQTMIRRLWNSGYRDAALLQILQRERIHYPVNTAFQRELLAAFGGNAGYGRAGATKAQ
ncbi:TIR domain-containing protein [Rhodanobacter sp. Col0626]|uniref:toll/interleukin-1 receptor domain-containing protein n=1 Tax=Rhodanobacter sp. Col0626 TaxID=3415679 RepID=UPI003CEA8A0C